MLIVEVRGLTPSTTYSPGISDFDGCQFFIGPLTTDADGNGEKAGIITIASFLTVCGGDPPVEARVVTFSPFNVVLKGDLSQ